MSIPSKLVCPSSGDYIVFTSLKFFSNFLCKIHYSVEIPVHDQMNSGVLKDMRNNEAYDAFHNSEVGHESISNNDIYCVATEFNKLSINANLINYTEKMLFDQSSDEM